MLAIFCMSCALNQVAWISLQPVSPQCQEAYGLKSTTVDTLSLVYQGLFVVFTFPSNIILDKYGGRNGIMFGVFLTALGMGIKCLINQGFWICILGQVLCAIGQPFISNAPAKVANTWFGDKERIVAITMAVAFQAIGAGIGFIVPSIWVLPDDKGQDFKDHIFSSLLA